MIREIKLSDRIIFYFSDSRGSKDIIELTIPIFKLRLFALFLSATLSKEKLNSLSRLKMLSLNINQHMKRCYPEIGKTYFLVLAGDVSITLQKDIDSRKEKLQRKHKTFRLPDG